MTIRLYSSMEQKYVILKATEFKDFEQELLDKEEIMKMIKNEENYVPKNILNKVEKYNRWVKEQRRKNRIWIPKAPRENVKEPFKNSDIYYAKSIKEIESNSTLRNMYEEGLKKGPIE